MKQADFGDHQSGLTLVELLIGLLIGLVLLLGLFTMYISNQQTARTQNALNDQTETLGAVSAAVTREVRRAGFNLLNEAPQTWLSVDDDARGVELRYRPPEAPDPVELHLRWDPQTNTMTSSRNDAAEVPLHPEGWITALSIACFPHAAADAQNCSGVPEPVALAWTLTLSGDDTADVAPRTFTFVTTARNRLIDPPE